MIAFSKRYKSRSDVNDLKVHSHVKSYIEIIHFLWGLPWLCEFIKNPFGVYTDNAKNILYIYISLYV